MNEKKKICGSLVISVLLILSFSLVSAVELEIAPVVPFPTEIVGGSTYVATYSFRNTQPTDVKASFSIHDSEGTNMKTSFDLTAKLNGNELNLKENESLFTFDTYRVEGVGVNILSLSLVPKINIFPTQIVYEISVISAEGWSYTIEGGGVIDLVNETSSFIEVTGSGTVSVYKYEECQVPKGGFTNAIGKYIDVSVVDPEDIDELIVRLYYTDAEISGIDESTLVMYWYDGTDWIRCSDTGVVLAENYIWARITSETMPSLSDLTGTLFGGYGLPPVAQIFYGGGGARVTPTPIPALTPSPTLIPEVIMPTPEMTPTAIPAPIPTPTPTPTQKPIRTWLIILGISTTIIIAVVVVLIKIYWY